MAVTWEQIEAIAKPLFDQGLQPERQDLLDIAFAQDADDDLIDALDALSNRPMASIDALKEQLVRAGIL